MENPWSSGLIQGRYDSDPYVTEITPPQAAMDRSACIERGRLHVVETHDLLHWNSGIDLWMSDHES